MKKRSPIFVFLIGFITIFVYSWYWLVKTKGEMNKLGQKIPTAFIWLIPLVGAIWWLWKYSEAVESVTNKEVNTVLAFVVLYLLGPIGNAIIQDYFNKVEVSSVLAPALGVADNQVAPPAAIQTPNASEPMPIGQPPTPAYPESPNQQPPNSPVSQ